MGKAGLGQHKNYVLITQDNPEQSLTMILQVSNSLPSQV